MIEKRTDLLISARPTIVVKCYDLRIAKRTIFVLEKIPSFIDLNLGFDLLPWAENVSLVGRGGYDGWDREPGGLLKMESEGARKKVPSTSVHLGGSRIVMFQEPEAANTLGNQATFGGFLILNNRYYGLTAAHAFLEQNQEAQAGDHVYQSDEESDWGEDFDLFQAEYKPVIERKDKHEFPIFHSPNYNAVYLEHEEHILPNPKSAPDKNSAFLRNLSVVGYLPNGRRCTCLPGSVGKESGDVKWMSTRLDWALICIHRDYYFFRRNAFITPDGRTIEPSQTSNSPPRGKVFLATSGHELNLSWCTGTRSGIFLPNSSEMQEVWALDTQCARLS